MAAPPVISQYANSPRIRALVDLIGNKVDPGAALDALIAFVWNLRTAQAWGLDNIGRIVGASRNVRVDAELAYFGFSEMTEAEPFGQEAFYNGMPATAIYALSDDAFRTLIMFKAMSNISDSSIPSLNRMLNLMFKGRGRVFVADTLQMSLIYHFDFALTPAEISIISNSGAVPQPAGVLCIAAILIVSDSFGFGDDWEPFGQGVFFNNNSDVLPIARPGAN